MCRIVFFCFALSLVPMSGCRTLFYGETRGQEAVLTSIGRNMTPDNIKYFASGTQTNIVESSGDANVTVSRRSSGRYSRVGRSW
jgi:hypothetical protein